MKRKRGSLFWQHLLFLESELIDCFSYVEPVEDNFKAYSIRFMHLILAAGAEVGLVMKELAQKAAPRDDGYSGENILTCMEAVQPWCPNLGELSVQWSWYDLERIPWAGWHDQKTPFWWKAYNNLKHERTAAPFSDASLENAVSAVSGLFLLVLLVEQEEDEEVQLQKPKVLVPPPSLGTNLCTFDGQSILSLNPQNVPSSYSPT